MWWTTVGTASLAAGPILGGFLVTGYGWQAVFWAGVPLGLVAFVLAAALLKESKSEASASAHPAAPPCRPGLRDRPHDGGRELSRAGRTAVPQHVLPPVGARAGCHGRRSHDPAAGGRRDGVGAAGRGVRGERPLDPGAAGGDRDAGGGAQRAHEVAARGPDAIRLSRLRGHAPSRLGSGTMRGMPRRGCRGSNVA